MSQDNCSWPKFSGDDFELLEKQSLYSGFFSMKKYRLRHRLFAGGWSPVFEREVLERGHAAACLLVDAERRELILIEQFRPGAIDTESSPWLLELVAGMIEEGESPEEVVRREAVEESGCTLKQVWPIADYINSPGGSTERVWLFCGLIDASQATAIAGLDDEHEDIRVHRVAVTDAFEWLEQGRITNAMTLIALQWLKLHPEKIWG